MVMTSVITAEQARLGRSEQATLLLCAARWGVGAVQQSTQGGASGAKLTREACLLSVLDDSLIKKIMYWRSRSTRVKRMDGTFAWVDPDVYFVKPPAPFLVPHIGILQAEEEDDPPTTCFCYTDDGLMDPPLKYEQSYRSWYRNGVRHRDIDKGPAIDRGINPPVWWDGERFEWWVNGVKVEHGEK